ncbi:MAG: hypothetical protein KKD77_05550 [Gammaproteobacteria bacterium]|nr:hypothetical protein [Gammaproteobacteria bacterium]
MIKVNLFESEEDVGLLSDEVKIIEMFKAGLKLFSPSFEIGCHYHKKRKVALRDSLCVVLQAKGSGKRPWIYQNYGMNQPNSLLTFCFIHWVRERLGANGWSESLVGIFSDKQQLPE